MFRISTWSGTALAAVLALTATGSAARADDPQSIDEALQQQAPQVLQYLRDQNYCHVGVLKFLVALGDGKLQDNVGAINRSLADRLEVALALALKVEDENKLDILLHASDEAAKDADLNHRTPEGRMAFFPKNGHGISLTRAWGSNKPVHADAFLTGEAVVAADWRSVRLRIQIFDKKNAGDKEMKTLAEFTAVTEARTLTDCGVSFARKKGAPDPSRLRPADTQLGMLVPPTSNHGSGGSPTVVKQHVKDMDELLHSSPVQLTILYDGAPQTIEGGELETPKSGKVAFRLKNVTDSNGDKPTTYGVVLKINGENSIERQRMDDLFCRKWVLEPGKEITVEGFQTNDKSAKEFKVLPPEQSTEQAINYDEDKVGVIQMVLFRAADKDTDAFVRNDEKQNLESKPTTRGTLDTTGIRPGGLKDLQEKLRAAVDPAKSLEGHKGLVAPGDSVPSETEQVSFTPYPTADRSILVHYYKPQK